jgi:16S rRNA (cytidine1402-2'-O)-methyltransferase|tara:strand:- start:674 stop:1342 length:669 start_codon:yes stop_codon:yes gene_type:complete
MGDLIIVPTPVGNLGDITLRALETFKSCDLILAEDTRVSSKLLNHYDIKKPLQAFHLANEHKVVGRVVETIENNEITVLISDAGTPAISDPGYLLVRACIEKGIRVECLPGATAFVPALVTSGLPCDAFVFDGFLPHKKGRMKKLEHLKSIGKTIVLYESPHRLMKLLGELKEYFDDDTPVVVSREISKKFEETIRGTAAELEQHFTTKPPKGEFVVVIGSK